MREEAEELARLLVERRWTLGTAESMTGGAIAEYLSRVPDSGEWFLGGVVAYASEVKYRVLGVPEGPVVTAAAAKEMAAGARRVVGADVAISTTGCAGPEPMEDEPVGTLWVGVAAPDLEEARLFRLNGEPEQIRQDAVAAALGTCVDVLGSLRGTQVRAR